MEELNAHLRILPLTPDLWTAFEDLFGKQGPCSRCWCMYWRIGPGYRRQAPETNKAALHAIVRNGPPPGLVAFSGNKAVGVTAALIDAAIGAAREAGARVLEAYPFDADLTRSTSFTGYSSTFLRAGFKIVARRVAFQPIMRLDLGDAPGGVPVRSNVQA